MKYLDRITEAKKRTAFQKLKTTRRTQSELRKKSNDAYDARDAAFERGDDEEAYKQGDKHHDALAKAGKLGNYADTLKKKVHLKGGGKGDGKPRGNLKLVAHTAYQQVGELIAEAFGLLEAKAKPIPADATPAQARQLRADAFYAKQSGRTPSTARNTRRRVNKGKKNEWLKRGSKSRNYRGRGKILPYEKRKFQEFLDQGVGEPEETK